MGKFLDRQVSSPRPEGKILDRQVSLHSGRDVSKTSNESLECKRFGGGMLFLDRQVSILDHHGLTLVRVKDPRSAGLFTLVRVKDPRSAGLFTLVRVKDPRSAGLFTLVRVKDPRSAGLFSVARAKGRPIGRTPERFDRGIPSHTRPVLTR